MSSTHPAPASGHRKKHVRLLCYQIVLCLGRQHQVSVALRLRSKSREDAATHAKVGRAHVGAFLRSFERKRNAPEVVDCQAVLLVASQTADQGRVLGILGQKR
jgi:hypothetical protein